jgi:acyl carrier protein
MNMNAHQPASVEATIIALTLDLVQDWGLDLSAGVSGATLLVKDMEFASVDIIQLFVAIEQHYERKLGFQELLLVDGSYVSDLSLGNVGQFVVSKLSLTKGAAQ